MAAELAENDETAVAADHGRGCKHGWKKPFPCPEGSDVFLSIVVRDGLTDEEEDGGDDYDGDDDTTKGSNTSMPSSSNDQPSIDSNAKNHPYIGPRKRHLLWGLHHGPNSECKPGVIWRTPWISPLKLAPPSSTADGRDSTPMRENEGRTVAASGLLIGPSANHKGSPPTPTTSNGNQRHAPSIQNAGNEKHEDVPSTPTTINETPSSRRSKRRKRSTPAVASTAVTVSIENTTFPCSKSKVQSQSTPTRSSRRQRGGGDSKSSGEKMSAGAKANMHNVGVAATATATGTVISTRKKRNAPDSELNPDKQEEASKNTSHKKLQNGTGQGLSNKTVQELQHTTSKNINNAQQQPIMQTPNKSLSELSDEDNQQHARAKLRSYLPACCHGLTGGDATENLCIFVLCPPLFHEQYDLLRQAWETALPSKCHVIALELEHFLWAEQEREMFHLQASSTKQFGLSLEQLASTRGAGIQFGYPTLILDACVKEISYAAADEDGVIIGGGSSPGLHLRLSPYMEQCGHAPKSKTMLHEVLLSNQNGGHPSNHTKHFLTPRYMEQIIQLMIQESETPHHPPLSLFSIDKTECLLAGLLGDLSSLCRRVISSWCGMVGKAPSTKKSQAAKKRKQPVESNTASSIGTASDMDGDGTVSGNDSITSSIAGGGEGLAWGNNGDRSEDLHPTNTGMIGHDVVCNRERKVLVSGADGNIIAQLMRHKQQLIEIPSPTPQASRSAATFKVVFNPHLIQYGIAAVVWRVAHGNAQQIQHEVLVAENTARQARAKENAPSKTAAAAGQQTSNTSTTIEEPARRRTRGRKYVFPTKRFDDDSADEKKLDEEKDKDKTPKRRHSRGVTIDTSTITTNGSASKPSLGTGNKKSPCMPLSRVSNNALPLAHQRLRPTCELWTAKVEKMERTRCSAKERSGPVIVSFETGAGMNLPQLAQVGTSSKMNAASGTAGENNNLSDLKKQLMRQRTAIPNYTENMPHGSGTLPMNVQTAPAGQHAEGLSMASTSIATVDATITHTSLAVEAAELQSQNTHGKMSRTAVPLLRASPVGATADAINTNTSALAVGQDNQIAHGTTSSNGIPSVGALVLNPGRQDQDSSAQIVLTHKTQKRSSLGLKATSASGSQANPSFLNITQRPLSEARSEPQIDPDSRENFVNALTAFNKIDSPLKKSAPLARGKSEAENNSIRLSLQSRYDDMEVLAASAAAAASLSPGQWKKASTPSSNDSRSKKRGRPKGSKNKIKSPKSPASASAPLGDDDHIIKSLRSVEPTQHVSKQQNGEHSVTGAAGDNQNAAACAASAQAKVLGIGLPSSTFDLTISPTRIAPSSPQRKTQASLVANVEISSFGVTLLSGGKGGASFSLAPPDFASGDKGNRAEQAEGSSTNRRGKQKGSKNKPKPVGQTAPQGHGKKKGSSGHQHERAPSHITDEPETNSGGASTSQDNNSSRPFVIHHFDARAEKMVGISVAKIFVVQQPGKKKSVERVFRGQIKSYVCATQNGERTTFFFVKYEDNDSEHVPEKDLPRMIHLHKKVSKKTSPKTASL